MLCHGQTPYLMAAMRQLTGTATNSDSSQSLTQSDTSASSVTIVVTAWGHWKVAFFFSTLCCVAAIWGQWLFKVASDQGKYYHVSTYVYILASFPGSPLTLTKNKNKRESLVSISHANWYQALPLCCYFALERLGGGGGGVEGRAWERG